MNIERSIWSLQRGEAAYTVPWAAWISGGDMWLNADYPITETPSGTRNMRLVKQGDGRLLVDMASCSGENFSTFCSFGENVTRVKVDEALLPPLPSRHRRVFDMRRGESAYIHPSHVWVFEGQRMWLNGYTQIATEPSEEALLRVCLNHEGAYLVDLKYCDGAEYATEPKADEPLFPIQVHRRIG